MNKKRLNCGIIKLLSRESMVRDGLVSTEWIYKNIFNFTEDQIKEMDEQITFDYKTKFRRQQIETEGNDPT